MIPQYQRRVYWKGDTQPEGEFIILSEGGEERFNPIPLHLDTTQPEEYPPIPNEVMPNWWTDKINSVKERIRRGEIEKEVIHRKITLPTYGIHPYQILKGLENKIGTHFAIELNPNHILFGITPEKPIERIHNRVRVEILGGSGNNKDELLNNPYKRIEHTLIQSDIQTKLNKEDIPHSIERIGIKEIEYIKHIQSHIQFNTHIPNPQLIPLIHPNLAIRGDRKGREYFGGLIGWETPTELHLWLTIRCGVWDGENYHFWVGCGITAYSNPEEEWAESRDKMKWILK